MAIFIEPPKPKTMDMAELFRGANLPERDVLVRMQGIGEILEAKSESFTIVMNRDVRAAVEMSSEMAVHVAVKHPDQQVLLVNSYASSKLLRRCLAHAMRTRGMLLPMSYKEFFEADYFRQGVPEGFVEGVPDPNPQNLRVLDCPVSTCAPWRIQEDVALHMTDIIIINSFEFAALSHWERSQLAEGLLALYARTRCTIVIYTQEMRADIAPYRKARGPIGILSAHAASVWRIMNGFEEVEWRKRFSRLPPGGGDYAHSVN